MLDLAIGTEGAESCIDRVEVREGVVEGHVGNVAPNVDPDDGAHDPLDAYLPAGRRGFTIGHGFDDEPGRHPIPAVSSADWSDWM